jgi:hypothetical protein
MSPTCHDWDPQNAWLTRASRTVEEEIPSTNLKRAYESLTYIEGGNSQYKCQAIDGKENIRRKARIVMDRYKAGDD